MRKLINIAVVAGMSSVLFTSCLKDTPVTDLTDNAIKPIVLVPNGNYPRTTSITPLALDFTTVPYELRVYARVSWSKPLSKSVDVTFKEDDAAIAAYNTTFGSNWVKLNATAYSIPSLKVTIPAGTQEAYIPVKVFPDKVDLTKFNMLAFTITDASGEPVATNYQTILTPILIKNIYEDDYQVTGYFHHPSGPRGINMAKYFATVNDKRVEGQLGDLGGWYFRIDVNGTALSNWEGIGATPTGANSGLMTADNPGAQPFPIPPAPGTAPWVHSTYNNSYDPATKTFWLHYGYVSAGGSGQNSWTRQIYEKWVRL
jgi:uncharacterized protein DUF1735